MARRFKRQESWRLKRVKPAWRRPRGGTSRIRLEISGWPRKPSVGFRTKGSIRGLHPSGLEERLVKQERDFDGVDPKRHIIRLAHQLGEKKRLVFLEKARQLNVKIANPGGTGSAARPTEETIPHRESKGESETSGIEQTDAESTSATDKDSNETNSAQSDTETRTLQEKGESDEEDNQ